MNINKKVSAEHIEIEKSLDCIQIIYYIEGEIFKSLRLIYADDYAFSGFSEDYINLDELIFYISEDNPLYFPLLHFIGKDKKIVFSSDLKKPIYDDLAYIEISKSVDTILFKLVNKIGEEQYSIEKFDYEIKNVMFDMRSKLDANGTNIKERLYNFFDEVISIMEKRFPCEEKSLIKARNIKKS